MGNVPCIGKEEGPTPDELRRARIATQKWKDERVDIILVNHDTSIAPEGELTQSVRIRGPFLEIKKEFMNNRRGFEQGADGLLTSGYATAEDLLLTFGGVILDDSSTPDDHDIQVGAQLNLRVDHSRPWTRKVSYRSLFFSLLYEASACLC